MNKHQNLYQKNFKLWAIIPAAGSGRRFSADTLKQYQSIQGQTVLQHSVKALNQLELAGYVLAISAEDQMAQTLTFSCPEKAHFCQGGAERVNTVLNALDYLSNIANDDDWVLVHDAARPCVHIDNLNQLVSTAVTHQVSAILATPVRDTLKKVHHPVQEAVQISHTVNRDALWQAQTPQIAQLGLLRTALQQALTDQVNVTDEASALEYISASVHIVAGRADNIKITYPEDLSMAALILSSR